MRRWREFVEVGSCGRVDETQEAAERAAVVVCCGRREPRLPVENEGAEGFGGQLVRRAVLDVRGEIEDRVLLRFAEALSVRLGELADGAEARAFFEAASRRFEFVKR